MDDFGRTLLLAIAALPACGPSVEDPSGDDEDDDGMPGDPEQLRTSCEAFFSSYLECYGDPENSYDPADYCQAYAEYFEAYGPACAGAQEEMFSCLAALDCMQLQDPVAGACRDSWVAAHTACPELFSFCSGGFGGSGDGACEVGADSCLDDRSYAVRCEQATSGGPYACTCTIDGQAAGSFESELGCDEERVPELAETHCGFPEGVP